MSEMSQYAGTSPSICRHSPGMLKGSRGRSGACFLVLVCLFWSFPAMPRILLQKGPLAITLTLLQLLSGCHRYSTILWPQ